jgi:molecular chaperone DnaK
MSKVIGIDLGTTNTCVAYFDGERAEIIENEEGRRTTPSIVAYSKGEVLVGDHAKRQAVTNAKNTIYSAKRFIGTLLEEVTADASKVAYQVKADSAGRSTIETDDDSFSPAQISAQVLRKVKEFAERRLGETVTGAVITVPAYFNDTQRQATKDAGKIAGLDVKRIINEPTAAALAYGFDQKKDQTIVVYDLGGGTFDISVLEVGDNVVEVISTNGDTHLGGDDFDDAVIAHLKSEFKNQNNMILPVDSMVSQRLREAAERAKIELSSASSTSVNLPFLTADGTGPKHLQIEITRSKFESLIADLADKTIEPCKKALSDADLSIEDIDEVILVGGSTRIPLVQNKVSQFFRKDTNCSVNPDEVVASGAALQAGVLSGDVKDLLLLDVTPLTLGIETMGGVCTPLIKRNTTIPTSASETFTTAVDNQTAVTVNVLQGERKMSGDNRSLGKFNLAGIPSAQRGVPQIEVKFDLDANGILVVTASDKGTGKKQTITIDNSGNLSESEISDMIQDAEKNAEQDAVKKEEVDLRVNLESMIHSGKSLLDEHKEKLSSLVVDKLEEVLNQSSPLDSDSIEVLREKTTELQSALGDVSKEMYADSSEVPEETSSNVDETVDEPDVIDADYVEDQE